MIYDQKNNTKKAGMLLLFWVFSISSAKADTGETIGGLMNIGHIIAVLCSLFSVLSLYKVIFKKRKKFMHIVVILSFIGLSIGCIVLSFGNYISGDELYNNDSKFYKLYGFILIYSNIGFVILGLGSLVYNKLNKN